MSSTATATPQHQPAKPFYFNTSAHLLRITSLKANTLAEFLEALRACPEDSIFQHTFRTLQEHHFIREGFSNDFAHWALAALNQPGLAEQLANVDVREYTSLGELRNRFVQIVENHLKNNPADASRIADETFYFCAADIVMMPTKFVAHSIQDFANGLREVSVHSIHHHFIEARLRIKLMSNDFSQWLYEDVGLSETARALNRIDIYTGTLEDVRRQIVRVVERALA
ncbi:MAG TPA: DUF5752 family protein [Terriglobales bacterium]|jgi:hypothetical protein|nr:DUF5752 family protein [Terriglobales bacterium]